MLDLTSAQVAAVSPRTVCLVATDVVRSGSRVTALRAADSDPFENFDHLRCVAPLARCDQEGKRAAASLTGKVDFAGQAAPGPSESLVGSVVSGHRPFSERAVFSCGPRRRADGPGRTWSRR